MIETLTSLFERDLNHLIREIESFSKEENLWLTPKDVNNSAGNLCLHLCGNLQHFIGAILGKSGYIRNRPYEFEAKDILKEELLSEISIAKSIVIKTIKNLTNNDLLKDYSQKEFNGEIRSIQFVLTHLHGHLTYHLGQISYYRRLLD